MRNAFLVPALFLPLALSCSSVLPVEEDNYAPAPESARKRTIAIRSMGEGIQTLDLLAFREEDGILVSREHIGDGELSFTFNTGRDLDLYLFANATDNLLDGIMHEEDLGRKVLHLELDNPSSPVLSATGHISRAYDTENPDTPLSFSLRRYMSKVTIGKITVRWLEEYDRIPSCTISRIALLSAMGTIPLAGGPSTDGTWFNCGIIDPSLPEDVAGKILISSAITVTGHSPIPAGISLYTMPNPTDAESWGLPWSPRRTRVAIELIIEGVANWYPVDLPAMECGCEYLISDVVITGPGSSSPDEKIERSKIEINLEVKPWETEILTIDFE